MITELTAQPQTIFNQRVIFDHQPKTAGQAINAWLLEIFGPATVTESLIGDHRDLIQNYGGNYNILSGHIDFEGDGLDPRYRYLTCLREPIDRAVSWLFYVNKNFNRSLLPGLWEQVDQFLQTDGDVITVQVQEFLENIYVNHFASVINAAPTLSDAQKLADAFSAIAHYDVVGVYDYLDGFAKEVSHFLNIANPPPLQSVNVTVSRPKTNHISDKLRQRLIDLNQLDLQLYHTIKTQVEHKQPEKKNPAPPAAITWEPYSRSELRLISVGRTVSFPAETEHYPQIKQTVLLTMSATIKKLNILINVYNQDRSIIQTLNSTALKQSLYKLKSGFYEFQLTITADLPAGLYQMDLILLEEHTKGLRELDRQTSPLEIPNPSALKDQHKNPLKVLKNKLNRLINTEQALPHLDISYEYFNEVYAQNIEHAEGTISCKTAPQDVTQNTPFKLDITIFNRSALNWMPSLKHPINLSYHWLNEHSESVVFEGERTPLPEMCLFIHKQMDAQMLIIPPAEPGSYYLVLSAVQEGVAWLEFKGFTPLTLAVQVTA